MIPVDQTMFYDATLPDERQRGNCWSAVLASLLELPIEQVPNFVQIDEDGGPNWWEHTFDWLKERGHTLRMIAHGEEPVDEYFIATGMSPRGNGNVYHAVIYRNGALAHDPHPERKGIKTYGALYRVVAL